VITLSSYESLDQVMLVEANLCGESRTSEHFVNSKAEACTSDTVDRTDRNICYMRGICMRYVLAISAG
jgi:hypothetical protein